MGMSGYERVGHLWACVKVAYCCDLTITGTLTHVKSLEMCVESAFVTVFEQFTVAGRFFYFCEDG
jgi:hypothetical protein